MIGKFYCITDQVLASIGDNNELFIDLLKQFSEQFSNVTADLGKLIQQGNIKDAASLLHQMKGAAGNIGAISLLHATQSLESELKNGHTPNNIETFNQALSEILASILSVETQLLQDNIGIQCKKCNWQHAAILFKQVQTLLDGYDYIPHEIINELKENIPCQPIHNKLDSFTQHIDATDYDSAKSVLESIICTEGHNLTS